MTPNQQRLEDAASGLSSLERLGIELIVVAVISAIIYGLVLYAGLQFGGQPRVTWHWPLFGIAAIGFAGAGCLWAHVRKSKSDSDSTDFLGKTGNGISEK